jgi:hypothetical protein
MQNYPILMCVVFAATVCKIRNLTNFHVLPGELLLELPDNIFQISVRDIHHFLSSSCTMDNGNGSFGDGKSLCQEGDEGCICCPLNWRGGEMSLEYSRLVLLPLQGIPAATWDDPDIDAHIILNTRRVMLAKARSELL